MVTCHTGHIDMLMINLQNDRDQNPTLHTLSLITKMDPLNSHTQTIYTELDDLTAKYSFLKNSELKAMTFSHIQDKNYRQCLLNAALTCKDFLDVALDALWEKMDSLVPLLKLLGPALQLELERDNAYVRANNTFHAFLCDFILSLGPQWEDVSGGLG